MFESAELGHSIEKKVYDKEVPKLRRALLDAQYRVLSAAKFPVIIVIGGVDGAGKGETVNLLNEWMDPRHVQVHAVDAPTDEERERPPMWRFWRELPAKGKIGIFFGSWYTEPIVARVTGETSDAELDRRLDEIVSFEKMLTDEGALLLKFWFHLSKKRQKKRLEELEADSKTRWRVTKQDWERFEEYDKFRRTSERALRETSRNAANWYVVEGSDRRYCALTAGKALLDAMARRLEGVEEAKEPKEPKKLAPAKESKKEKAARNGHERGSDLPTIAAIDRKRIVEMIDLSQKLDDETYEEQIEKWQRKLNLLLREPKFRRRSAVAVFEGVDAAGKGGAIRRITQALDARWYRVVPIAAPTDEERAQPYLWRFWRHLPRLGRTTIFDRSWYGRVLVERVEKFAPPSDWERAYAEINDFEEQLHRHGAIVAKFWLQVSPEEQLRRFKERERVTYKRFKIGPDDWRNREKWDAYQEATCDMIDRTSTEIAPWTLIAAEDKKFARVEVLKALCKRIEGAL
jgi:AMP-polyphosphate phosphotransferase